MGGGCVSSNFPFGQNTRPVSEGAGYAVAVTLRMLLPPAVGPARATARAELLEQSLRLDLGEAVRAEVAADYDELEERILKREPHIAWVPPNICGRLWSEMRVVYTIKRRGRTRYRSSIVVRRGTAQRLSDLRGRRAAWVERSSVGGYLLAAAALAEAGLTGDADWPQSSFLGSYPAALRSVVGGTADVTAVMVHDDSPEALRDVLELFGGRFAADRLVSLHTTRSVANDAVVLTRALSEQVARQLSEDVFERTDSRAHAVFCLALDAEGFARASRSAYVPIGRLSEPPSP